MSTHKCSSYNLSVKILFIIYQSSQLYLLKNSLRKINNLFLSCCFMNQPCLSYSNRTQSLESSNNYQRKNQNPNQNFYQSKRFIFIQTQIHTSHILLLKYIIQHIMKKRRYFIKTWLLPKVRRPSSKTKIKSIKKEIFLHTFSTRKKQANTSKKR